MKMKMKIVCSSLIFLLLFSTAWLWDSKNKRDFYEPVSMGEQMEMTETIPMNVDYQNLNQYGETTDQQIRFKGYKIFRPREYVRIEQF